eukprot:g45094.t1
MFSVCRRCCCKHVAGQGSDAAIHLPLFRLLPRRKTAMGAYEFFWFLNDHPIIFGIPPFLLGTKITIDLLNETKKYNANAYTNPMPESTVSDCIPDRGIQLVVIALTLRRALHNPVGLGLGLRVASIPTRTFDVLFSLGPNEARSPPVNRAGSRLRLHGGWQVLCRWPAPPDRHRHGPGDKNFNDLASQLKPRSRAVRVCGSDSSPDSAREILNCHRLGLKLKVTHLNQVSFDVTLQNTSK